MKYNTIAIMIIKFIPDTSFGNIGEKLEKRLEKFIKDGVIEEIDKLLSLRKIIKSTFNLMIWGCINDRKRIAI